MAGHGRSSFANALRAINDLKADGVVEEYAIAGAMALAFWAEPVPTFDLDVLVLMREPAGPLVSLDSIYKWAKRREYRTAEEHVIIDGVPTQFVPSPNRLADDAIASAETMDYEGVAVRVVRPEQSRSDSARAGARRSRPSRELLGRLRAGKAALRGKRAALSLPEKVQMVLDLPNAVPPLEEAAPTPIVGTPLGRHSLID